jgi:hypothetical protein
MDMCAIATASEALLSLFWSPNWLDDSLLGCFGLARTTRTRGIGAHRAKWQCSLLNNVFSWIDRESSETLLLDRSRVFWNSRPLPGVKHFARWCIVRALTPASIDKSRRHSRQPLYLYQWFLLCGLTRNHHFRLFLATVMYHCWLLRMKMLDWSNLSQT